MPELLNITAVVTQRMGWALRFTEGSLPPLTKHCLCPCRGSMEPDHRSLW